MTALPMCPRVRRVLCILLMLLPLAAFSQQYSVTIHCPEGMTGRLTFLFFDNDTTPQRRAYRIRGGEVVLEGSVANPHLVEVSNSALRQPMYFILENSNIDITLNAADPAASRVTGSRANSQYRYALEECSSITQLVENNPSAIYTPFVIQTHLDELTPAEIQRLFPLLSGAATQTYHYRLLTRRLSAIMATLEGARMPDFVYADAQKKEVHFDSVRADSLYSVVLFTASYSEKGRQIEAQLKKDFPLIHRTVVAIDNHRKGWDAPYLELLAVDRIPYMILLDDHGCIHTRDARIWELKRLLDYTGKDFSQPKEAPKK